MMKSDSAEEIISSLELIQAIEWFENEIGYPIQNINESYFKYMEGIFNKRDDEEYSKNNIYYCFSYKNKDGKMILGCNSNCPIWLAEQEELAEQEAGNNKKSEIKIDCYKLTTKEFFNQTYIHLRHFFEAKSKQI